MSWTRRAGTSWTGLITRESRSARCKVMLCLALARVIPVCFEGLHARA